MYETFSNSDKANFVGKPFSFSILFRLISNNLINILKAIKNATGTSVICPINISLIHFVFVLTSVPNVGERFTETWAQLHTSAKNFGEK